MNWIKIGERLVNLDLVTFVHLREDGTAVQVDHADEDTSFYDGEEAEALRGYFASLVADGTIRDLTPGARIGSPSNPGAGSEDWRTAASLGEALRGVLGELGELSKASLRLGSELPDTRLKDLYIRIRKARWDIRAAMESAGFVVEDEEGRSP